MIAKKNQKYFGDVHALRGAFRVLYRRLIGFCADGWRGHGYAGK